MPPCAPRRTLFAAAWSPATRPPSRWPEAVVIGSPTSERTLSELALRLPGDGMLWLADADQLDAGLAADILLASDRNLEPYQRAAVATFAQAELERTRRTIVAVYSDIDPGFERFRASLVPPHQQRSNTGPSRLTTCRQAFPAETGTGYNSRLFRRPCWAPPMIPKETADG